MGIGLLVVDMQDGFLGSPERPISPEVTPLLNHMGAVLRAGAEKQLPTFIVEYEDEGHTHPAVYGALTAGYQTAHFPTPPVITKKGAGSFTGTELEKLLRERDVSDLVVMGVNASACVLETVFEAGELGFSVMTSKDILGDFTGFPVNPWSMYARISKLLPNYDSIIQALRK